MNPTLKTSWRPWLTATSHQFTRTSKYPATSRRLLPVLRVALGDEVPGVEPQSPQDGEERLEVGELQRGHAEPGGVESGGRPHRELAPLVSDDGEDAPAVARVALAADQSGRLQPVDHIGHRGGVHLQPLADLRQGQGAVA